MLSTALYDHIILTFSLKLQHHLPGLRMNYVNAVIKVKIIKHFNHN